MLGENLLFQKCGKAVFMVEKLETVSQYVVGVVDCSPAVFAGTTKAPIVASLLGADAIK